MILDQLIPIQTHMKASNACHQPKLMLVPSSFDTLPQYTLEMECPDS